MRRFRARFLFEPRDMWVGLYWDRKGSLMTNFYICIVPCFPLLVQWWHGRTR